MARSSNSLVRMLSASSHASSSRPQAELAPADSSDVGTGADAASSQPTYEEAGLPLVEVAGAVAAAVRGLVPSCSCAIVVRTGHSWQILAQSGAADIVKYHRRHLAASDLATSRHLLHTDRHLVAGFASRRVAACLLLVASPGRVVPDRAPELLRSILDCAAAKLDAAATLQQRDRALRRSELLRLQGGGDHVRTVGELERAVGSLWSQAKVRYVSLDVATGFERPLRRLVREACTTGATSIDAPADEDALLPIDWTHRIVVPVSARGGLVIEPAASGEPLDDETVAAASVVARVWALVEQQEALRADLRSLREEDRETGCMTGSSLLRRLEGALHVPATGGQAAVLVLQIDQLNAATDMALAVRIGRLFASIGAAEGFDVFRMRPWRYAIVVPSGTLRSARALAQRLRLAVRQLDGASCTASIGIALAPAHGSTAGELVDAAEHAMNLVAADGGDAEHVASQPGRSRVVEADIYRKIEALRTLAGLADQVCHGGLAHSHAVAQRATRIAVAMDLDRQTVLAVQLAGELHEIGSLFVGGGEEEDRPNAVRVLLASRLIRMAGLHTASEAVAAMHERIDGSGVPGHEQGDAIPIGARILAVANAIETVLDGLGRGDRGLDLAIRHVRDQSGKSFDRKVAAIALAHARDARNQAEHPPLDGATVQQPAATLAA